MNIGIVKNYIRRHFKLATVFAICMALVCFLLSVLFPEMNIKNAELISSSWPDIMKTLFGDPLYAFTDINGWMYLEIFHITFWAFFGILSSLLASTIIAEEIENRSIDILLSYPIGRIELIISRITGLIVLLFYSISLAMLGSILGIIASGQSLDLGKVSFVFLTGFLLILDISVVTLFISIIFPNKILSIIITLGIFSVMFLYEELLVKIVPFLNKFSFISFFHYYKPENILIHNIFSITNLVILTLIFVFFIALSLIVFKRKNISI